MEIKICMFLFVLVPAISYSWFVVDQRWSVNVWLRNKDGKVISFDNSVHDAVNKVVYFLTESGDGDYESSNSIYTEMETLIKMENGKKKICYYLDRSHCTKNNCYKQDLGRINIVKLMPWLNVTTNNTSLGRFKKGTLINIAEKESGDFCSNVNTYKLIQVTTKTKKPYVTVNTLLGDISIESESSQMIKFSKLPNLSEILRTKIRFRLQSPSWGRKRFRVPSLLQARPN